MAKKVRKQALSLIEDIVNKSYEKIEQESKLEPVITYDEVIEAENKVIQDDNKEIESINEQIDSILNKPKEWDVSLDDEIEFFDPNLSYELTGYKPINETKGLDFNPDWFIETREKYLKTNHYCQYPRRTKAYNEFWDEQYKRCREGMTVNGYTITGDHYFFLNFYQLDDLTSAKKGGGGRQRSFPSFFAEQYKYFHYLELCKRLRKDCVMMKARGVGFSEMDAALLANSYNSIRNTMNVVAAQQQGYLETTLEKIWNALSFLNEHTDGGFFKLRQVTDTALEKTASVYKVIEGQKNETGWMSTIRGINADKPNKIRGKRTDLLFYEESGSWPQFLKAYIQGEALVGVQGSRFGIRVAGGTGGDAGMALEGLRTVYENPEVYNVLPFKHNYTPTGDYTKTGFFIPAFNVVNNSDKHPNMMDKRGFTDPVKGKAFYDAERASKQSNQKGLLIYIAEYCYTAEEAFSQEGDNKFNKVNIVSQLTRIRALHECPPIQFGSFNLLKNEGSKTITGSTFIPNQHGKVQILEPPIWETEGGDKIHDLYVAGIDGIDIGKAQTSEATKDPSDFCIVIKRRAYGLRGPQYVACYKDRPYSERDAYKIAMGLMMYYNAKANIEASRLSMLTWAKDNKLYNWFMARPASTYSDISKRKISAVGTPATPAIINHQTDLIKDFTDDYCDELWFEDILDELNRYSDENKRKFDYVAAMGMAELADEELNIRSVVPKKTEPVQEVKAHLGFYYDERGYKRYGMIPNDNKPIPQYREESFYRNYENGIRSSDPRTYL